MQTDPLAVGPVADAKPLATAESLVPHESVRRAALEVRRLLEPGRLHVRQVAEGPVLGAEGADPTAVQPDGGTDRQLEADLTAGPGKELTGEDAAVPQQHPAQGEKRWC